MQNVPEHQEKDCETIPNINTNLNLGEIFQNIKKRIAKCPKTSRKCLQNVPKNIKKKLAKCPKTARKRLQNVPKHQEKDCKMSQKTSRKRLQNVPKDQEKACKIFPNIKKMLAMFPEEYLRAMAPNRVTRRKAPNAFFFINSQRN